MPGEQLALISAPLVPEICEALSTPGTTGGLSGLSASALD
jgi:hypothetical protein